LGSLVLVGGGMRSGKSRLALELAESRGARRRFLATGRATDDEMTERIRRHQQERGEGYATVECPIELIAELEMPTDSDAIVIDCLTFWIANLLEAGLTETEILAQVDRLVFVIARSPASVIVVSNEVGMGLIGMTELGRRFQELAGFAHQRLAAAAAEVYLAIMGCTLRLRPAPITLLDRTPRNA
jgi:adenosylcobinamide kinase / adenosylcobinamide-phosphate guanylyltransferase